MIMGRRTNWRNNSLLPPFGMNQPSFGYEWSVVFSFAPYFTSFAPIGILFTPKLGNV